MTKRVPIRSRPTVLVRIFPEDKTVFERNKVHPRETVADVVHRARLALLSAQEPSPDSVAEVPA